MISIRRPPLNDPDLAYETGVHLGDGSLARFANGSYRYVISGNRSTETEYYDLVLRPLVKKLYGLTPSVWSVRNSIYLRVYSKDLFDFKTTIVGLPAGRKGEVNLPRAVVDNGRECQAQLIAGLFDADGCVKVRRTTSGVYPRISFAQKRRGIVEDVKETLRREFGIPSTTYRNDYHDSRTLRTAVRWFLDINGFVNLRLYLLNLGTRHPNVQRKIGALLDLSSAQTAR